ncbi:TlpA family protein disulfide reductase [Flavobacteriaceae bacterium XHP0103]|uniref:TlpA family protein disulfide reductase n=1 Tax=Marixanthotalea marina TaxID=2844359 RepID=UPI002989ACC0|nr:TlpA disulfide reductase family protein [Marixanthotalea marina]MBU3821389.1 TlpA family protein disulfide reductase [Marixanthotalea marina]
MKLSKDKIKNILLLVFIVLLVIPQTRKPIQVMLQKGVMLISSPSVVEENKVSIDDYNWRLLDEKDVVFNFQNTQGNVVLVNFWATWCPPCIAEMPSLQSLFNDYQGKVDFLFITSEDLEVIKPFMQKHDYTFSVYRPAENYPDYFNVSSIPRTFLIDKNGQIIIDETGANDWNSESVRSVIDELIK